MGSTTIREAIVLDPYSFILMVWSMGVVDGFYFFDEGHLNDQQTSQIHEVELASQIYEVELTLQALQM
jgi:hypothetical protein